MRIAVEGCCHGELDTIYSTLQHLEERENVKIDLLLICGDFQSIRNTADMDCLACPQKYRQLGSFHQYYTGEKKAPFPTLFIGGNHEASNYLWELYHGGWVCPNIYFLGYSGVINFGGLRIGGISGIYKYQDFDRGYYERFPYSESDLRSIYHVRRYAVDKVALMKSPIDVFLSHDWPRGIHTWGNRERLSRRKPYFAQEMRDNTLGSPPNEYLLHTLKPRYWFSAHLHVKFAAIYRHEAPDPAPAAAANPDEIIIDDSDFEDAGNEKAEADVQEADVQGAAADKAVAAAPAERRGRVTETKFLALDKCLPKRDFLQVVDIPEADKTPEFSYDLEWLAIVRVTDAFMPLGRHARPLPLASDFEDRLTESLTWVSERVSTGQINLRVPNNFEQTVAAGILPPNLKEEYKRSLQENPQTAAFCRMLGISTRAHSHLDAGLAQTTEHTTVPQKRPLAENPDD